MSGLIKGVTKDLYQYYLDRMWKYSVFEQQDLEPHARQQR